MYLAGIDTEDIPQIKIHAFQIYILFSYRYERIFKKGLIYTI